MRDCSAKSLIALFPDDGLISISHPRCFRSGQKLSASCRRRHHHSTTLPSLEDLFACEKTHDTLVHVRLTFAAANVALRRYVGVIQPLVRTCDRERERFGEFNSPLVIRSHSILVGRTNKRTKGLYARAAVYRQNAWVGPPLLMDVTRANPTVGR